MSIELQAASVRAAEMNALKAGDWLIYDLAKAERKELCADEDFNAFDFVAICKQEGIDWKSAI